MIAFVLINLQATMLNFNGIVRFGLVIGRTMELEFRGTDLEFFCLFCESRSFGVMGMGDSHRLLSSGRRGGWGRNVILVELECIITVYHDLSCNFLLKIHTPNRWYECLLKLPFLLFFMNQTRDRIQKSNSYISSPHRLPPSILMPLPIKRYVREK